MFALAGITPNQTFKDNYERYLSTKSSTLYPYQC